MDRMNVGKLKAWVSADEIVQALFAIESDIEIGHIEILQKMVNQAMLADGERDDAVRDAVRDASGQLSLTLAGMTGGINSRALADSYVKGSMPPGVVRVLYAMRTVELDRLAEKREITRDDLQTLDRHGRFEVANEMYVQCDGPARAALLDDTHPHVRSTAVLSQTALLSATPLLQQFAESVVKWRERSGDPTLNDFVPAMSESLQEGLRSGMSNQAPRLLELARDLLDWQKASGDPTISDLLPVARVAISVASGGGGAPYQHIAPFITPVTEATPRAVPPWMTRTSDGYSTTVRLDPSIPEFRVAVSPLKGDNKTLEVTSSYGGNSHVHDWARAFSNVESLCIMERSEQIETLKRAGRLFDVTYVAPGTSSRNMNGAQFSEDEAFVFSATAGLDQTLPDGIVAAVNGRVVDRGSREDGLRQASFEVVLRVIADSEAKAQGVEPPARLLALVADLMGAGDDGMTLVEEVDAWSATSVVRHGVAPHVVKQLFAEIDGPDM